MADKPAIPDGLPLIEAACTADVLPFGGGADFWENLDEVVVGCGLGDALDRALAGRVTPRIWVLVHEPGHPQLAVAAALGFARALADRGQAALVLDGDDHATALSRWAGREDHEGWIDVVRYGTSVLTSGVALPFPGRTAYLLGVGSYAPTDVTPEEIDQLLGRLRRQADDLLVVLPGGAQAAAWARRADIRLLCHDQAELTPARLAAVVANLTKAGVAPTGLVGFGKQRPAAAPVGPEVPAATVSAPAAPTAAEPAVPQSRLEDEPAQAAAEAAAPAPATASYARRRGSSAVFWLAAAAAVVMIALVGTYYLKFVRGPAEPAVQGPVARLDERPAADAEHAAGTTGAAAPATVPTTTDRADTLLGAPAEDEGDAVIAAGDQATTEQNPEQASEQASAQAAAQQAAAQQAAADQAATATPEPDQAAAQPEPAASTPATTPAEAAPVFDPAPYRVPVGSAGWALQVYSFRDSTSAGEEMARLQRRGLRSAARVVELPESGRWWRVYVGSFASRREARAAEPALFRKLRVDWAQPSRFTVAVTDTAGPVTAAGTGGGARMASTTGIRSGRLDA